MRPEAIDGQSAATALDACGESPRFLPTTPSSGFAGRGGAPGDSCDDYLESSSSFLDQQQDGESDALQLDKEVCQLKNSIEELLSLLTELDHKNCDLSHELHQLHSVIDDKTCGVAVKKLVELLEQLKDLERQESGLESKLLISDEEISSLSRSKCGSIDLDSHLINSTNKLNSLKRELATKMKANFSLRCQLDDVPVQTELIQYERRFSELYAQIQEKHHLTRRHYATYNALLEIKELMLKEASLLNSIHLQFKDAMTTSTGRSKLLDSMEVIVKGTKHKLEKVKLDLLAEQKVCDYLKEKHTIAAAEQRHFSSLLKTFQDACREYERLRQIAST